MSGYGLKWTTNTGTTAITTDGFGLAYYGKATQEATIDRGTGYANVQTSFLMSCDYVPLVFLETSSGNSAYWVSTTNIGTGQWRIIVSGMQGQPTQLIGPTRYIPTVHCFAQLAITPPSGGVGILALASNGQRSWDSRENMINVRQIIDWSAQSFSDGGQHPQAWTIPSSIVRPAHCGIGRGSSGIAMIKPNQQNQIYQFDCVGSFFSNNGLIQRTVVVDNWNPEDTGNQPLRVDYQAESSIVVDINDYVNGA